VILVTGATGTVGGHVLTTLCGGGGVATRGLVRSPERADTLRGYDCDVVVGDFADPASLDQALEDVEAMFLISPTGPGQAELETNAVDAAARAGVRRIVKVAAIGYDDGLGPIGVEHARVVRRLRETGIAHTVLAPNDYLNNLIRQAAAVQEEGVYAIACGDAAVSSIDARDVAEVAVHLLTSDAHDGATYTLTGPQALTKQDVAAGLSKVAGRDVRYVAVDPDEERQGVRQAMGEWYADAFAELHAFYRAGRAALVTDEVRKATGRDARSLEAFLADHASAFAPPT
jgi:uncharacterized protein YbjT (DUF2867 family)